jgi:predicted DNA-binding transcriptional regulator AlpA
MSESETLLNERQVATQLQVSLGTVRRWRCRRTGPRFIKVSGSLVRYAPSDLRAYLNSRPTGGGHPEAQ